MPSHLSKLIQSNYTQSEVEAIGDLLYRSHTFDFDRYSSGLYPAVGRGSANEQTSGYRAIWIRDNVHIAYAHLVCGDIEAAVKNTLSTAAFFTRQHHRFIDIIERRKDAADPMNRPHIRYDGETGDEILERWPHAQNDALGAFLWLFSTLLIQGNIRVHNVFEPLLLDFVQYFRAIEYWKDEDSGHWEETRKISASSIGAVAAGLMKLKDLLRASKGIFSGALDETEMDALIAIGMRTLEEILPFECIQEHPEKSRRYDASLLFLIDPFDVVDRRTADQIILDIDSTLKGDRGIARYLCDSYWGPQYRNIPPEKRTIDLSEDIIQRSDYSVSGMEARWTIFDPVLSVIYGKRYRATFNDQDLARQIDYFNRSLFQLVESSDGEERLMLPEAYFMENGKYIPNDHMPLQWAHANLMRAVFGLRESVRASSAGLSRHHSF
jgi:phosphorylase kinase alpha/beta subunit